MNRNKLVIIKELSLEEIDKDSMKFIIDGKDIQTKTDYLETMTEKFELPKFNNEVCNMDGLIDWMRDLTWLEEKFERLDNISLIIKNYRKAFNGNFNDIDFFIIDQFVDAILPYWENHETHAKKFNVYLVENLK